MKIRFIEREVLKERPDQNALGFGKYFTDYMFMMDYTTEKGWHDARIIPYGPIQLDPSMAVLHYAQETFEGLKAYRRNDGNVQLFRPEMNARRMMKSNERLCMPKVPEDIFIEALKALVSVEKDWVPSLEETSLYIRPFVYANEVALGVHPAASYQFVIILSPVGEYYKEGMSPIKIWVEDEFVRAVKGGTGFAKCGGNYAGGLAAQSKANQAGYAQVLWLDGNEKKYVEEVGSMNIMFLIDDEIVTAPIDGTILPGITRDSLIHILKDWGYKVSERRLSIDELMEAARTKRLKEAFGTGTAAVIAPIGELSYKNEQVQINNFETGELTQKIYDELTGIQWGKIKDSYGWTVEVK